MCHFREWEKQIWRVQGIAAVNTSMKSEVKQNDFVEEIPKYSGIKFSSEFT